MIALASPKKIPIKNNRPRSVSIAAILQIIQGLGLLGYGGYQLSAHGWGLRATVGGWRYIPFPLFESMSSGIILAILGFVSLVVAIAFLTLKPQAWQTAMTLQGFGLVVGLINYFRNRPNYVGMALGVLLVLYLNHQEVREAFRVRRIG